jgi:diguanylate cyclase (GGDEF)-like protein
MPSRAGDRNLVGQREPQQYRSFRGVEVVGSFRPLDRLGWDIVAETEWEATFAPVAQARNGALIVLAAVLVGVSLTAYILGLTIVRPLHRLTSGAAAIAEGDLLVELPVVGSGELVSLTNMFNLMVFGLREAREKLADTNTVLRDKNRVLHEISIKDGLTGAFNRNYLTKILTNEFNRSRRNERSFAVLMVDIDHFKNYNDAYGHQAGDAALTKTAKTLQEAVRNCDYVARYGGEEFLLLLPETGLEDAEQSGERIRHDVDRMLDGDDERAPITISVGVASYPDCGDDVDEVVRAADVALYEAKRAGRNRVMVARPVPKKSRGDRARMRG